jgi:monofunctional chorismate mutase
MSVCLGVRGAITAGENSKEAILSATDELLREMVVANNIEVDQVAAAFFTTTEDLNACFPAEAARHMGWDHIALICSHEISVPDGLSMCIRILILVNTEKKHNDISHVYLKEAKSLRP